MSNRHQRRRRVRFAPRFNRVCGSSAIFHFTPADLPQAADDTGSLSDKFTNHRLWATTAAKLGRPFRKLPFRGAMYLINSGENHSALTDNIGWRRELLRRFTPARCANDELRAEFALNIDGEHATPRDAKSGLEAPGLVRDSRMDDLAVCATTFRSLQRVPSQREEAEFHAALRPGDGQANHACSYDDGLRL